MIKQHYYPFLVMQPDNTPLGFISNCCTLGNNDFNSLNSTIFITKVVEYNRKSRSYIILDKPSNCTLLKQTIFNNLQDCQTECLRLNIPIFNNIYAFESLFKENLVSLQSLEGLLLKSHLTNKLYCMKKAD